MDRRDVLVGLGSLSATCLAGCSAIGGGDGGNGGPGSATAAVRAYWDATEAGNAERLNEIMHERHPLYPVDPPPESIVPESVELSDVETRSAETVYSDVADQFDDAAAFEATIDRVVEEIDADGYAIVYHAVTIRRGEDQPDGYREPSTIVVESGGRWRVLVNADQLREIA